VATTQDQQVRGRGVAERASRYAMFNAWVWQSHPIEVSTLEELRAGRRANKELMDVRRPVYTPGSLQGE